jgi:hypothetical protein
MHRNTSICLVVVVLLLSTACGDDTRPLSDSGTGDTSIVADSSPPDTAAPDTTPPMSDGNDDFTEAEALTLNDGMGVMERIQAPGDRDYFTVDLTAGDWVVITTTANPDDDIAMVDTVIQLFDGPSEADLVAENDDSVPRVNTDSELIYHVPVDGTYYVRVLEFTDWMMETPLEGEAGFTYTLAAGTVDPDAAVVTIDGETGNDAASAQVLNTDMDYGIVLGTFADGDDVDVFSFSVTDRVGFEMMPSGTTGYGSTSPIGNIWISDMAGTEIIGRLDNASGAYEELSPALPAGDYLLHVEHGGSAVGENDFFVLKAFTGLTENPPETMEADNGTLAGAEALTQELDMEAMLNRAFVLAQLGEDDVDYYSFAVADGEVISVGCGSRSSGSGVMGLRAEIRDDSDAVIGMALEAPPDGLFIDGSMTSPPGAGTYYLRLTKTGQDAEVASTYVRCGVATGAPAP